MTTFYRLSLLVTCIVSASCSQPKGQHSQGGLSPEEALKSFEVADGFQIELVAAEPLISDPVAMEVDASGKIYVVEMHGYPLDTKGSGVIKILTDTNSDGIPDKSTVFADGLILPNGIQCWKNGVIVTDMPDILYLEDTDGDLKADKKEVMITGFARSNPQHNGNTPLLAIDNWIYIAHEGVVSTKFFEEQFGGEGAEVKFTDRKTPALPVNANGRSIRFKPDTYQLEMLSGYSQYGHTFSPFGEHLNTANADHLFHEVIAARYLERNPAAQVSGSSNYIPDHGDAAEVFPITRNPEHQLLTDVGVITSSCGVTWYGGGLFPKQFDNVTFIAEPVHNLVHADVINDKGASFVASRLYPDKEFLASTDAWSRPVSFYNGPDGAFYVIDYYRQIIEHPEWMSEEVTKSGALYNGSDKGRIYRITPKGTEKMKWVGALDLAKMTTAQLVQYLGHDALWWRRTSQRLLVDRKDPELKSLIAKFIDSNPSALGFTHALWVLEGTGNTDTSILVRGLKHEDAGARINAIRIAEPIMLENPQIRKILISMRNDVDARVRFQLLCTLGFDKSKDALESRMTILKHDINDPWVSIAALSASPGSELALVTKSLAEFGKTYSDGKASFYENAGAAIGKSNDDATIDKLIDICTNNPTDVTDWWQGALLKGLNRTLSRVDEQILTTDQQRKLLRVFREGAPAAVRHYAVILATNHPTLIEEEKNRAKALTLVSDKSKTPELREDAILLLTKVADPGMTDIAAKLFEADEPENVQRAGIRLYIAAAPSDGPRALILKWNALTPPVRYDILRSSMRDTVALQFFLSQVKDKKINPSTISWPQTVGLMNHENDHVRQVARNLLAGESLSENELLKKYGGALEGKGDQAHGEATFKKVCSSCHQIHGKDGVAFGPDLATIRNRDDRFILLDIVNPNRSIADGYELWTVNRKSGEELSGVVASQTSSAITIRSPDGQDHVVNRADIQKMEAIQTSAMPQTIGSSLSVDELRNLIAYLKKR